MRALRATFAEIAGLFVDDGALALALLAWCAAVGFGGLLAPGLRLVGAPVLLLGCVLILLATVLRAARPR